MERLLIICVLALCSACASLPDKQSVDVGQMRYAFAKHGTGTPTVVFEAGFGSSMDDWHTVFGEIGKFTTVFAYNRRGYEGSKPRDNGKSLVMDISGTAFDVVLPGSSLAMEMANAHDEVTPTVTDGRAVITELRQVLSNVGLPPPYILVGHSLGGTYMELFARTYPQDTAALLLVDMRPAHFTEQCKEKLPKENCDIPGWLVGIFPDYMQAEYRGAHQTAEQIDLAGPLPPVPVVVFSSSHPAGLKTEAGRDLWHQTHKQLVQSAENGTYMYVDAGHFIQKDRPDIIVETVRRLVLSIRHASHEIQ